MKRIVIVFLCIVLAAGAVFSGQKSADSRMDETTQVKESGTRALDLTPEEEIDLIANLDILENYDVLMQLDFFENFDSISFGNDSDEGEEN